MTSTQLSPAARKQTLASLRSTHYDVLVIGGGVTGAGAALDAATRGLSVALVEKRDWAAGTSSRSGKLFHGGVRYLEQLNFGLVREALHERALMLQRLCPHLAHPIEFIYPLRHRVWERPYMGAGLLLYDTLGGAGDVPRHRHLTRAAVSRRAPGMSGDHLIGAVSFYDGQVDDARHTLELVRTAAGHGADVASAIEVVGLVRDGERVVGAQVRDGAETFEIRARAVVNATGVWTDTIRDLAPAPRTFEVTASKGVHLMIPRHKIDSDVSMFIRAEDSVLFVRTWNGHWLVGTTDTPYDQQRDHPASTSADVEYLLRNLNTILKTPLTAADVDGVYAGLRPLVKGAEGATSALSREHAIETAPAGLTSIAGGKYTTYRVMAADVIDAATADFAVSVAPSRTEQVPLLGARRLQRARVEFARRAHALGLTGAHTEHLLGRYGSLVAELCEVILQRPDLARPLAGAPQYLRAEITYAARFEGALHVDDALTRRTRIAIETADRGLAALEETAELLAAELGWSPTQESAEVERYRQRVAAERAAERLATEAEASDRRAMVPDPRLG